ncbi:MAG: hypothetical protein JF588_18820 [Caulobacterales bacterium]|nr:hypothetical protein [Caulobacterales bacterium]
MDDPKPAPEPRPLYTPEFAAKRRRSIFWAMIMCLGMGAALTADALYQRTHGGMVSMGYRHGSYPWWMVVPMGVGLLMLGAWGLWDNLRGRD